MMLPQSGESSGRGGVMFERSGVAALAVSLALAVLTLAGGAGAVGGPGFHAAVTLPGSNGGSEPSLAISTSGIRYASWQSPGEFASSPDGVQFTNLGMPDDSALGDVT